MISRAAAGGKSQELLFAGEFIIESLRFRGKAVIFGGGDQDRACYKLFPAVHGEAFAGSQVFAETVNAIDPEAPLDDRPGEFAVGGDGQPEGTKQMFRDLSKIRDVGRVGMQLMDEGLSETFCKTRLAGSAMQAAKRGSTDAARAAR